MRPLLGVFGVLVLGRASSSVLVPLIVVDHIEGVQELVVSGLGSEVGYLVGLYSKGLRGVLLVRRFQPVVHLHLLLHLLLLLLGLLLLHYLVLSRRHVEVVDEVRDVRHWRLLDSKLLLVLAAFVLKTVPSFVTWSLLRPRLLALSTLSIRCLLELVLAVLLR